MKIVSTSFEREILLGIALAATIYIESKNYREISVKEIGEQ